MGTKTLIASAIVLGLMASPTVAENAHHYLGGPKTVIPHLTKHPETGSTMAQEKGRSYPRYSYHAHRYQGAPTAPVPHSSR